MVLKFIKLFVKFGRIIGVDMPRYRNGCPAGFMYLCYDTPDSARRAKDEMNEMCFNRDIPHMKKYLWVLPSVYLLLS